MRPLSGDGFQFELSNLLDAADDAVLYGGGGALSKAAILVRAACKRLADRRRFHEFDIIFVQREAWMLGSTFFERSIKDSGAKFVFDFDDSIWLMDTSPANKRWEWLKNPGKTAENIKCADMVFAGNPYLAEFASRFNPNVRIVPTTIDTDEYRPEPGRLEPAAVTIGWSGSVTTIRHFEFAVPALKRTLARHGSRVRFEVIGDQLYKNSDLGIEGQAWVRESEVADLRRFDIGIMPLPNDEWARGKCGLKGLQYMALGIPTVMSPVGVNSEIIEGDRNGLLASTEDEWVEALDRLVGSATLRSQLGAAGRATVVERYSVRAQHDTYRRLLNEVLHPRFSGKRC